MVYQGGETTDGKRIYVGNINYDYSENEIRNAFNDVRFALLFICTASPARAPCAARVGRQAASAMLPRIPCGAH